LLKHFKNIIKKPKDVLYIKQYSGIQLAEKIFKDLNDEFTVKVASKKDEITALLEVGFEYISKKDELYYFRKRK